VCVACMCVGILGGVCLCWVVVALLTCETMNLVVPFQRLGRSEISEPKENVK
jgi:hypothetical protein